MRNAPLTDLAIRSMQPPEKGYRILWDGALRGFGCRISQAGTRAFVYLVESGKPLTLGRYPAMSLSQGRSAAKKLAAEKTLNIRRPAAPRTAFEDARRDFLKDCEGSLRPGTLRLYRHHLTRHFHFGRQTLADIEPRQIVRALKDLPPSQHEHAVRIGKTFFRWAIREHLLENSPMSRLSAPPGAPRTRVLSKDELGAVYRTARASDSVFGRIVTLLVLTGQRRSEIAALQWSWIDQEQRIITFPGAVTKNKREHAIPYGDTVADILASIPKLEGSPYVFPAQRQSKETTTVFNGWGKPKARFDKECGVTGWTLHDIRRTYSSGMAALGVDQLITERLLNHATGIQTPIARIYNLYEYMPQKRKAVLKWERYLATLSAPKG